MATKTVDAENANGEITIKMPPEANLIITGVKLDVPGGWPIKYVHTAVKVFAMIISFYRLCKLLAVNIMILTLLS